MKKISIIILHYGKISTTKLCIKSLLKNEKYPFTIIVVNNTKEILNQKDLSPKKIIIFNNKMNKGFAGGVNVGLKYALSRKTDAVFLLNNDTTITKPILNDLSSILFSKKEIGIVGPAVKFIKSGKKLYDLGGYITPFGKTYHNEVDKVYTKTPHDVTYVTGAAMLIKKDVFKRVGLFDEKYFLYYEDVDFCLRAKKKKFKIFIDPKVYLTHALSKTAGRMSPFAVYHQTRSAFIFRDKYIKSNLQKFFHFLFLVSQSTLFTFKQPNAGLAAWKAFFEASL